MTMLATPATKMARKSTGRRGTFAQTGNRKDLVVRVRRATFTSLEAEPCVPVFGAVARLRFNDLRDWLLRVLPVAALVPMFIWSPGEDTARLLQKILANSRRKLLLRHPQWPRPKAISGWRPTGCLAACLSSLLSGPSLLYVSAWPWPDVCVASPRFFSPVFYAQTWRACVCRELVKPPQTAFPGRSPIQLVKPRTTSTNSRVAVSVREGFLLFFERTGQLPDRLPMAGRVGRELRTPVETPVSQPHRLLR